MLQDHLFRVLSSSRCHRDYGSNYSPNKQGCSACLTKDWREKPPTRTLKSEIWRLTTSEPGALLWLTDRRLQLGLPMADPGDRRPWPVLSAKF